MMMKRSQKTGLIALIGAGIAGGLAYWKYKTMSPSEKAELKAKLNNAGDKIKETATDVETSLSEKYAQLKNTVQKKTNEVA